MAHVEVVNRQVIDGKERKRGEVVEVSEGRARDLIAAGKVRAPKETPKAAPATKEGAKNG